MISRAFFTFLFVLPTILWGQSQRIIYVDSEATRKDRVHLQKYFQERLSHKNQLWQKSINAPHNSPSRYRALCNDSFEPNQNSQTAYDIGVVEDFYAELCLAFGDRDWLSFIFNDNRYFLLVQLYMPNEEGSYGLNIKASQGLLTVETVGIQRDSIDTKISLYTESQILLVEDDDDGIGLYSKLEYDPTLPDLTSPLNSVLYDSGPILRGNITIVNVGGMSTTENSEVLIFLTPSSEQDSGFFPIKSIEIPVLEPGDSIVIDFFIDLISECDGLPCVPTGGYRFHFEIDHEATSGEENRDNNFLWFPSHYFHVSEADIMCRVGWEPNYSYQEAIAIENNNVLISPINKCPDLPDWYSFGYQDETYYFVIEGLRAYEPSKYGMSFKLEENLVIVETFQVDNFELDSKIQLFDSNLNLLTEDDDGGHGKFSKIEYYFVSPEISALTTIFVDSSAARSSLPPNGSSWERAFPELQDALKIAGIGDTIWIAKGTYYPDPCLSCDSEDQKNSFVLKNGITLIGGFEGTETALNERDSSKVLLFHSTRLSGDIGRKGDSVDNSYNVLSIPVNIGSVMLDGLIIEEGHANGTGDFENGGGIWARNSFTLQNCFVQNNSAKTKGGGVYAVGKFTDDLTFGLANTTINRNHAEQGGGVFSYSTDNIFNAAVLENNQAEIGGGLYMDFTTSWISNTFFVSNDAVEGGGIFSKFIRAIFSSCTFQTNSAERGGGMYYDNFNEIGRVGTAGPGPHIEEVDFFSCIFSGNTANKQGGGMYSKGGGGNSNTDITFTRSIFKENLGEEGGGLYSEWDETLNLYDCQFLGNIAELSSDSLGLGGGAFINNSDFSIDTAAFHGNIGALGGGLYILGGGNSFGTPTLKHSLFSNNNAIKEGGGVYINTELPVEISHCQFLYNTAQEKGGGVYQARSEFKMDSCLFQNDTSYRGGAMYLKINDPQISNTDFFENLGSFKGGALFIDDSDPTFTNCNFNNNLSQVNGGAITNNSGELRFQQCTFKQNTSEIGGAVVVDEGSLDFDLCYFWQNRAYTESDDFFLRGGGALYINAGNLLINRSVFEQNSTSEDGGGIQFEGNEMQLSNTSFIQNSAEATGGAIFTKGAFSIIQNSTFTQNISVSGGAIYHDGFFRDTVKISYCSIVGNGASGSSNQFLTQGGGGLNLGSAYGFLKGNVISNNMAQTGPDILAFTNTSNTFSLGHNFFQKLEDDQEYLLHPSDIYANISNPISPQISELMDNGGLRAGSNKLSTPILSFMPEIGSPLLGAGDPIEEVMTLEDQRGFSRVVGSKLDSVDIGSIEYQETHVEAPQFQICSKDQEAFTLGDIRISDSTGGAWEVGENQQLLLAFPKGVQIKGKPIVETIGNGLKTREVEVFDENTLAITYDRFFSNQPNELIINNLHLSSELRPGNYALLRTALGDAVQVGNSLQDSIAHAQIWVLPTILSSQLPFDASFESNLPLWQPNSDSSLWELSTSKELASGLSSEGNSLWITNPKGIYLANTHASLYSPCFDLSRLPRPMLSLEYWSDTEIGLDGVVLQASTDRGKNWQSLGTDTSGINWYDTNILLANPGSQPTDRQFGWTGEKKQWLRAAHRIPDSFSSPFTRFRMTFRSSDFINPTKQLQGFAFDNFWLGNRNRNVLLEYFPSTENTSSLSDAILDSFQKDLIPISYFIEENSPLSQVNSIDPEARALFYSISTPGNVVLGGNDFQGSTPLLTSRTLDTSSLELSSFVIQIDPEPVDPLTITARIVALEDREEEVNIFFAFLEDGVEHSGTRENFVLRKFLPNAEGILEGNWQQGESREYTFIWPPSISPSPSIVQNLDSLYAVVFIQDPSSKKIYQAARTGRDGEFLVSNEAPIVGGIHVFPNPARDRVWLEFPPNYKKDLAISLINIHGQELERWETKDKTFDYTIDLSNFSQGLYFMVYFHKGTVQKTEKLFIRHK